MPKKRPVSLAPVNLEPRKYPPVAKSAEQIAASHFQERAQAAPPYRFAADALDKFSRVGYRAPQGPTPERLVRAQGYANVQQFSEVVEISKGDVFEPVPVDMVRIKVDDDPFSRLCKCGLLAPKDKARNMALSEAGLTYRRYWRNSGLDSIKSIDMTRDVVSGGGAGGLWSTEAQADAFTQFRAAKEAIPRDYRPAVEGIVLIQRNAVDVGREIGGYAAEKQAVAIAMYILRLGLEYLALHFKLIEPATTDAAVHG
jgi:hypothetical protein